MRFINGSITALTNINRITIAYGRAVWRTTNDGEIIRFNPKIGWKDYGRENGYNFGNAASPVWTSSISSLCLIADNSATITIDKNDVLYPYNLTESIPEYARFKDAVIFSITNNKKTGDVWIITSVGLISIEGSPPKFSFIPENDIAGQRFFRSSSDAEGNLWFVQYDHVQPGSISEYRFHCTGS